MPDLPAQSAALSLPYLQPAQAQKHVTHNEALRLLDTLVQLRITGFDATTPPATPEAGEVHALGSGATGDWAGNDGMLAVFTDAAWQFIPPQDGWLAIALQDGLPRVYLGGVWGDAPAETDNLDGIGIGGAADAVNRLLVTAPASLFTHEGAGHQVKVNKADLSDTASLLFQTGFSGRAEMGLAGEDSWSIKTSADGTSWVTALRLEAGSGLATGAAVQNAPGDTTAGRLMRADYGFGPGNLLGTVSQSGGVPTGAVIERGSTANGDYTKFADGTLVCRHVLQIKADGDAAIGVKSQLWNFPTAFADTGYGVSVNVETASPQDRGVTSHTGAGTGSVTIHAYEAVGRSAPTSARVTATGRWF